MDLTTIKRKNAMKKKNYTQRKTTLKWKENGDLSELDMLRILDKLSNDDLSSCELTCDIE
tara:strand:+ start:166 stop:345 length:180 start_codon:yes stop_codon:yes gene_type:complete